MELKCIECGKPTKRKIDSYQYLESGLDNVFLQNVPIYECNCGAKYPSIFRMGYLNELIGETLLEKQSLLSGKEIKFLRKNLYLSSKDYANALGVGTTTLSKWENEKQTADSDPAISFSVHPRLVSRGTGCSRSPLVVG